MSAFDPKRTCARRLDLAERLVTPKNNATFCDAQHTEPGALFVFYKGEPCCFALYRTRDEELASRSLRGFSSD